MSESEPWRNPEMNSRWGAGDGGQGAGMRSWGYVGVIHKPLRPMPQGAKLARDPTALPFTRDASGNTQGPGGGPPPQPGTHLIPGPVACGPLVTPQPRSPRPSVQCPQGRALRGQQGHRPDLSAATTDLVVPHGRAVTRDGWVHQGVVGPTVRSEGSKERLSEHPWEVSRTGASGQEGE